LSIPLIEALRRRTKAGLSIDRGLAHGRLLNQHWGFAMISVLIGVLIICVVGAICFWAIDKFVREARLANLLKLLVVLICLASILQRVLPLAGVNL
jgi:hypothetical protein